MNGIKKSERSALVLAALLLFSTGAFAALPFVSIEQKTGGLSEAYALELVEFGLIVSNNSSEPTDNIWLRLNANEGSALVKGEAELSERDFLPFSLAPGETLSETIYAKALSESAGQLRVSAEFGLGAYTNASSAILTVQKSPLHLNALLNKTFYPKGETGEITVELSNQGSEGLANVTAGVKETEFFAQSGAPLTAQSLAPGQAISNGTVSFEVLNESPEKEALTLQIEFTDSKGRHLVEKTFEAGVQERTSLVVLVIGLIIVLAAIGIFLDSKPKKPLAKNGKAAAQKKA